MKVQNIKLVLLLAVLMVVFKTETMAQEKKKYKELRTLTTSTTINVSSNSLWEIVSHPDISLWSTLLDSTNYFGEEVFKGVPWSKRISIVNAKGHHESHETLFEYNPSKGEIKFTSTKLPSFIYANQTHWRVIKIGEHQSVLELTTIMKMKGFYAFFLKKPMLKAIRKNAKDVCYDIKHYAESGAVSPTKKARIERLKKMKMDKKIKIVQETITSQVINVSADSLWSICRAFDKTAVWTSTLNHSYGSGESEYQGAVCSYRTCETNIGKGSTVVEKLTMFSDEKRELAYNLIQGVPGFITLASNHWQVVKVGENQSKIVMNVTMHMKQFSGFFLGGIITKQMRKQVKIVQDELKIYAETGSVSEAKKRQIIKQERKNK